MATARIELKIWAPNTSNLKTKNWSFLLQLDRVEAAEIEEERLALLKINKSKGIAGAGKKRKVSPTQVFSRESSYLGKFGRIQNP